MPSKVHELPTCSNVTANCVAKSDGGSDLRVQFRQVKSSIAFAACKVSHVAFTMCFAARKVSNVALIICNVFAACEVSHVAFTHF